MLRFADLAQEVGKHLERRIQVAAPLRCMDIATGRRYRLQRGVGGGGGIVA